MSEAKKDDTLAQQVADLSIEGLAASAEEYLSAASSLEDELETARAERDDYRDRFMRALADFGERPQAQRARPARGGAIRRLQTGA